MFRILAFSLVIIAIITACKKNDDPQPTVENPYKMVSYAEYQNADNSPFNVVRYLYDSAGNFWQTSTLNYGDTYLGREHFYKNGVLQYACYMPRTNWWDTVFYYFSASNRLDSTVEHDKDWNNYFLARTRYFYNASNQVIHSYSSKVATNGGSLFDSVFYIYAGSNITRILWYTSNSVNPWILTTYDLYYDTGRNYYKTTGMPPVSYHYWPDHNIVKVVNVTSQVTSAIRYFDMYNGAGYPTRFRDTVGGTLPHEVRITYNR
jgi:hypothetical protein